MAITIPFNEANWVVFLKAALKAGIRVRSRYKGVYLNKNGALYSWMARYQGSDGAKFIGRFELSKLGEKKAFDAYNKHMEHLKETGVELSNHPGRVIKGKIKTI